MLTVKVLFICLIFRLTFAGLWSLSVCKSSNLKQNTLPRTNWPAGRWNIISSTVYNFFPVSLTSAAALSPASRRVMHPSASSTPLQPSPRGACQPRCGSFGPSLRASTTVCAWAVPSHVFDQQMQNLADPHHVLTPVPVYPRHHQFLLPPLACSSETWAKPHWGRPQKQTRAARIPAAFCFTGPFSQCCFIPSLKHCWFVFFKSSLGRWSWDKDGISATFCYPEENVSLFFCQPSPLPMLKIQRWSSCLPLA